MKRLATIVGSAVLALGVLAGCGSDDGGDSSNGASGGSESGGSDSSGGDYCSSVEDLQGTFKTMASPKATVEDMRSASDAVNAAAESAPSDVSSDWDTLSGAMDEFVSTYEDSGMATDEPIAEAGPKFAKEDPEAAKKLAASAQEMSSEDVKASGEKIEKQVKDECDVDLSTM